MTDFLAWLVESGDRITVVVLLLIVLFVIVYGVQQDDQFGRPWWVPGWMLKDCIEENEGLKAKVAEYVQKTQERVDKLEAIVEEQHTRKEGRK